MKLMFFIKAFLGAKGCFTEILIKTKSELTLNFLAFLQETLYLTYTGYSKSLVNKSQNKEVDPTCVCSLLELYTSLFQLLLCWAILDCKITTHF